MNKRLLLLLALISLPSVAADMLTPAHGAQHHAQWL